MLTSRFLKQTLALVLGGALAPVVGAQCIPPPVDCRVSSHFGMRMHPTQKRPKMHRGTDFACPLGTPVPAVHSGIVDKTHSHTSGGKTVVTVGGDLTTKNLHLHRFHILPGAAIEPGTLLGDVGSTGDSTGPHLHFEVIIRGRHVDPQTQMCGHAPSPTSPDHPNGVSGPEYAVSEEERLPDRYGMEGAFWDVMGSVIAARSLNSAYPSELATLTAPRLYEEWAYLQSVQMWVDLEKTRSRHRLEALEAAHTRWALPDRLAGVEAQRGQANQSAHREGTPATIPPIADPGAVSWSSFLEQLALAIRLREVGNEQGAHRALRTAELMLTPTNFHDWARSQGVTVEAITAEARTRWGDTLHFVAQ
jgi:hypothetical protein